MRQNLARWIVASLAVYFKDVADAIPLPFLVEGVDERSGEDMTVCHAELRISGPFVKEVSKDYWRAYIDINVILTNFMQMSTENAYSLSNWGGYFLEAMMQPIPIYKYGDGPDDDDSLIGCLEQRRGFGEPIRLIHFGQISRVDRIRQAVVDGKFEFFVSTG